MKRYAAIPKRNPRRKPNALHPLRGVKKQKPEVRVTGDGRTILRGDAYEALRNQAYDRDGGKCQMERCLYEEAGLGRWVPRAVMTLDHIQIRGMGSGRRNDVLSNVRTSHFKCNAARGSRPA